MLNFFKFVLLLVLGFVTSSALAGPAKIIKVDKNSNRVLINRGLNDQIQLKDEVCVFINDGVDFHCGIVAKLSSSRALVKIRSRRLKRGMKAYFVKDGDITQSHSDNYVADQNQNPFDGRSVHGDFIPSR